MPSNNSPSASASLRLTLRYRTFLPSARHHSHAVITRKYRRENDDSIRRRRVPAEKVLPSVRKQVGIIDCAPAADNRIVLEVQIDSPHSRFVQQLRMRSNRIKPSAGLVGVSFRRRELPVGPRDEILPVGTIRMSAVMLTPRKTAIEHAGVNWRHSCGPVVSQDPQVFCA